MVFWESSFDVGLSPAETSVGATRRFFGCSASCPLLSSFSVSLAGRASRLPRTLPLTEFGPLCDTVDIGVWGGVLNGRAGGWEELAAVTSGTAPKVGVGLLTTAGCWAEDWVVIEHAELERAGLAGGGWLAVDGAVLVLAAWLVLIGEIAGAGVATDDAVELAG